MLPSSERLNRLQFNEIASNKDNLVVYNKLGTLKYIAGKTALSVVISRKNEKKAVKRNKLRRRVYSIFNAKKMNIRGILYVSKSSTYFNFMEIKDLFYELMEKTKKTSR